MSTLWWLVLVLELLSTCHVVIFLDIELADWTCGTSFKKPFVDTIFVEGMEAGHRSQIVINLILHQANHAFCKTFIVSLLPELIKLFSRDLSDR